MQASQTLDLSEQPYEWTKDINWSVSRRIFLTQAVAVLGIFYMVTGIEVSLFNFRSQFSSTTAWIAFSHFYYIQLCISAGAHRFFIHFSYTAYYPMQYVLAAGFAGAGQGDLVYWSKHDDHHHDPDGPKDPHSPWASDRNKRIGRLKGWFWAHVGSWCSKSVGAKPPSVRALARVMRNSLSQDVVAWERKYHTILDFSHAVVPIAIGFYTEDVLGGFLVGYCLRKTCNQHLTWVVNSFGHLTGTRTERGGKATNTFWYLWFMDIITAGEWGSHGCHHADPRGVRISPIDPGYWLIWLCVFLGLANWEKRKLVGVRDRRV